MGIPSWPTPWPSSQIFDEPELTNAAIWQARIFAPFNAAAAAALGDTNWIVPALASPWAAVAGEADPGYRIRDGIVMLRGGVIGGAAGSTIFTLPTLYRPATQKGFILPGGGVNFVRVDVLPSGVVQYVNYINAAAPTRINLDTIRYPQDA